MLFYHLVFSAKYCRAVFDQGVDCAFRCKERESRPTGEGLPRGGLFMKSEIATHFFVLSLVDMVETPVGADSESNSDGHKNVGQWSSFVNLEGFG